MEQSRLEARSRTSLSQKTRKVFRRPAVEIGLPADAPASPNSFLGLPGEIRNLIYEHIFNPPDLDDYLRALQLDPRFGNGMAILRTCRRIYHETRDFAYGSLTATLSPFDSMLTFDLAKLEQTRKKRQVKPPLELVKRITVQQHLFYGLYPWWKLPPSCLQPEELVVQVCICTKLKELWTNPSHTGHLCDTLERAAVDVKSIRRIVVYYCGCEWPNWLSLQPEIRFPNIVASSQSTRGGRLEAVVDESAKDETAEDEPDSAAAGAELEESETSLSSIADERHYVLTGEHFSMFAGRQVNVDFCDSMTICGKRCVRDRAPPDLLQLEERALADRLEPWVKCVKQVHAMQDTD